jgi:anti-sigma factor RsiW
MASSPLTCRELVELVTEYVEASLPAEERVRFEAHLARCTGCRNHVEQMRQTIMITGRLAEEAIAPEAQRELLRLFRDWRRSYTS